MTEAYIPTAAERENLHAQGDFLKLSGDGVFATLQGEGATAGVPAVFLRLQTCNLQCGANGEGWRCDAWYTWDRTTPEFWQETTNQPVGEVVDRINAAWEERFGAEYEPTLVITGGEPMLQQTKMLSLIQNFPDWKIEIETNGTIMPSDELKKCQINCSPKLSTSGNTLRARYRPDVLKKIASFPNHWFKFVVASESDVQEIIEIVEANGFDFGRVLLMSEGIEPETLRQSDERLSSIAHALGCAVTARNQIFWFGNTRAT